MSCDFNSNGFVSANIDATKYKFATYDSSNGPKLTDNDSKETREAIFYSMYQPAIVNGILNYQNLSNIHSNASNLFTNIQPVIITTSNTSNSINNNTTNTKQLIKDIITNKDNNSFLNTMFILIGILLIVLFLAVLSLIFYRT